MLERKIESVLEIWLRQKYALLVDGARQVGKTFILKEFARRHFANVIYLNLYEDKNAARVLKESVNSEDFLFRLTTVVNKPFVPHQTVIFLDEIQQLEDFDIVTTIKFLVDEGSYRYMLSGSLLGVELFDINSWPVGYLTYYTMYPLDFEEFLWANGVNRNVIDHVRDCFVSRKPVEDYLHEKMMLLFMKYILVGGMPEAVNSFIETNNFQNVEMAQAAIYKLNEKDIAKYARNEERLKIKEIYRIIPSQLNSQSKRFQLCDIENKKRSDDINASFAWLRQAGVAIPVYNAKVPQLPLRMSEERTLLKLFMADIGLLTYALMDSTVKHKILSGEKNINFGSIYENVCAQLLIAHGFEDLFYYSNKKMGEIDFVVEKGGHVLPLEIKSGKDYKKHSALNNLFKIEEYDIREAYIFCPGNVRTDGKCVYFPDYMIEFLTKQFL